jgi:hypothetical protein
MVMPFNAKFDRKVGFTTHVAFVGKVIVFGSNWSFKRRNQLIQIAGEEFVGLYGISIPHLRWIRFGTANGRLATQPPSQILRLQRPDTPRQQLGGFVGSGDNFNMISPNSARQPFNHLSPMQLRPQNLRRPTRHFDSSPLSPQGRTAVEKILRTTFKVNKQGAENKLISVKVESAKCLATT